MLNNYNNDQRIKGFRYADERERIQVIKKDLLLFHGRHSTHTLHYNNGAWYCNCHVFLMKVNHNYPFLFCAHTIAVERMNGSLQM